MGSVQGPARSVVFLVWRDCGHPEGGGSETFVERVATHLAAHGTQVTICTAAYPGVPRKETRDGVTFRRRGGRLSVYLHGLLFLLGRTGRRADTVVDVQNGVPFFSRLVRRRGLLVLVHHIHREQWQIIYPGLVGHLGWWIESRLAPRLYRGVPYLTVSEATRRELAELGVEAVRVDVVQNGIDVPRPDVVAPAAPTPTVCVLGRLVPHKQIEHALEVVARLTDDLPQLHLDVIGDGWWRDRLDDHVRALGIGDHVTFHGFVPDDRRDALLDRAWVLLVPSVKEGWGIAIMEAAARGVPAIAYATAGGVTEAIVEGETGRLVHDLDGLAKRCEELLRDDELRARMAASARERAARFDWATTGYAVQDVLTRRCGY